MKIRIPIISTAIGYASVFVWTIYHLYKSWKLKRALKKLWKITRHYGLHSSTKVKP